MPATLLPDRLDAPQRPGASYARARRAGFDAYASGFPFPQGPWEARAVNLMDDPRDDIGVHQARTEAAAPPPQPEAKGALKTVVDTSSAESFEESASDSPLAFEESAEAIASAAASGEWKGPSQLGHFRLVRQLGQGGMGHVFLARDTRLDRDVALKTLRPEVAATHPEVITRFLHEARSAAKLTHPNIVQVYFAGVDRQTPYFAMELVSGRSLKEMIHDDPLPADRAIGYALQAARGLKAAAEKNIVHRDIKPANLMVDEHDVVKIADFGLAKNFEAELGLTKTGVMVGTPYYMSPEQSEGGDGLGFKSDIYSLGATLYHLVAGRPPFLADTPVRLMVKHATEALPKHESIDGPLYRLVAKMMAKKPEKRHGSYDELIAEMEEILELSCERNPDCDAAMATPRMRLWLKRARMVALAIAVACVAAGVGIGSLLSRGDKPKGLLASSAVDAASLDSAAAADADRAHRMEAAPPVFSAKPEFERIAARLPKPLTDSPEFARAFYEKLIHYEFVETLRVAEELGVECPLTSGSAPSATMPVIEAIMREQIGRARAKLSLGEPVRVALDGAPYALRAISSRSVSFVLADAQKAETFELAWRDLNPYAASQIFHQSARPDSERDRLFLLFWDVCFDTPKPEAEQRAFFEAYPDGMQLFRDLVRAHWAEVDPELGAAAAMAEEAAAASRAASAAPVDYSNIPAAFTAKPETLSIMPLLPKSMAEDPDLSKRFLEGLLAYDTVAIQRLMQDTSYAHFGDDRIPAIAQPVLDQAKRDVLGRLAKKVATGNGPTVEVGGERYVLVAVDEPGPILGFALASHPDAPAARVAWRDLSPAIALALVREGVDKESAVERLYAAHFARMFDQTPLPDEEALYPEGGDSLDARRELLKRMLEAHMASIAAADAARPPREFTAKPETLSIIQLMPPDPNGSAAFHEGLLKALNSYDFLAMLRLAEETNYAFMDDERVVASAMPVLDSIIGEYVEALRRLARSAVGGKPVELAAGGRGFALRDVKEGGEPAFVFQATDDPSAPAFEIALPNLSPAILFDLILKVADPSLERDRLMVVYFARTFDLPDPAEATWGSMPNGLEDRRRHLRKMIQAHWALTDERDQ